MFSLLPRGGGRPPAWPSRFLAKAVKGGFVHRPGDFGTELRFRAEQERVGVGARSASTGPQWNFQVTRLVWDSWPDPATPHTETPQGSVLLFWLLFCLTPGSTFA